MIRLRWLLIPGFLCLTDTLLAQTPSPSGEQIFNANCAACHGLDGKGGEHAPNVAGSDSQRKSDGELANIVRKGIPAAGMPAFHALLDDRKIETVVNYLRILQQHQSQSGEKGDANRGRVIFFGAAHCADCHMMDGHGGFLGADLSAYGATHQPSAIRDWILHPDQNPAERHGMVAVVTRRGQHYRGLIRNEDNFSLQIQTLDGRFRLLDKADLASIDHENRALMPSDYGKTLSPADLSDVVVFLAHAKEK